MRRPLAVKIALALCAVAALACPVGGVPAQTPIAETAETILTLQEEATAQLPPDMLTVTLRAEAQGKTAAKVQQEVNRKIAAALAKAKAVSGVTVTTGGYAVFESAPALQPARPQWQASQAVSLVSRDFEPLLALWGNLQQDGMLTSGMAFELSPDLRETTQQRLVGEAIAKMKMSADQAAAALGLHVAGYKVVHLIKGPATLGPLRHAAMPAMMTAAVPPSAEAAAITVRVDVDGEIICRR